MRKQPKMRFIHTADWQIGMPAAQFGAKSEAVREARFASLERIISVAVDRGVDFIIVSGDVFDDLAVPDGTVQRVARIIGKFGKPIYLLPGNHDPGYSASLWNRAHLWSDAPNAVLMLERKPIEIPGGYIFPCPLLTKTSVADETRWIADHLDLAGYRIGVGHGGLRGAGVDDCELNFPIARDAAEALRLDYLALGDWHGYLAFPDSLGAMRTVYSGTHERTSFSEKNPGNVVLVEIEFAGDVPLLTTIPVGELNWTERIETDLSKDGLIELVNALRALESRERQIVRLKLDGVLRAEALHHLSVLRSLEDAGFMSFDLDQTLVRTAPDDMNWVDALPIGPLRDVGRSLSERALTEPDAMGALELLYDIASRKGIEVAA